jgi:hypothetical protein
MWCFTQDNNAAQVIVNAVNDADIHVTIRQMLAGLNEMLVEQTRTHDDVVQMRQAMQQQQEAQENAPAEITTSSMVIFNHFDLD